MGYLVLLLVVAVIAVALFADRDDDFLDRI